MGEKELQHNLRTQVIGYKALLIICPSLCFGKRHPRIHSALEKLNFEKGNLGRNLLLGFGTHRSEESKISLDHK